MLLLISVKSFSQRPMEKLDRGLYVQRISNGNYINWRINADEYYNCFYKVYRNGSLIYTTNTSEASNYLDASGTTASKYTVSRVKNGVESAQCGQAGVNTNNYIDIPMRDLKSLGKQGYFLNDATAADLDGDGQYEIIVKRLTDDWSVECTNYTYFEAYKLDGTFLWAIDVGPNITANVEQNIAAYDFDGDGKAEVFMRTSEGTKFGLDKYNHYNSADTIGDVDGDGLHNYRYSIVQSQGMGFMNAGPEYLSLIDGATGKELDRTNFIPRGSSSDWGDGYGHRANKFFFGAPFLDGKKPSLFIGRGIYTMTKMQTYDIVNKKLVKKWYWECTSSAAKQQGKWDDEPKNYFGQGYHNYSIADVDDDGKDEINWGSMTIDDDGKPLYSTELGHGDAQHYGDFDPYRKGQEAFACNEDNPGTNLRDAKTGKLLYRHVTASDCGRCCVGNITDAYKGAEAWGGGVGISCTDRNEMTHFGTAESYCIYWDGDLLQEMDYHSGFSTSTGVGYGEITKFNGYGNISTLLSSGAYSCNYTKGTPCLQADLFGDWREEVIWWRTDSLALRIFSSPYPTTNRVYSLLADHQYRQAICWQMCGYNQPPHTSFYLGSDFPTPIPPKTTNGKLVWKGTTTTWDATTANWTDGDDAVNQFAGTAAATNFADGKEVLFDTHATNTGVNISGTLSPSVMTVTGEKSYNIGGTGTLSGGMILDKMGDSTLVMSGTHNYTGPTTVWEGNLWMTGNLTASNVMVRRHANFGAKGTFGNGINTEYNAGIYVGGQLTADTTTVSGTLNVVSGAKLIFDLSDNPTIQTTTKPVGGSSLKNDCLKVNGTLQLGAGAIIQINESGDSISIGQYLLGNIAALSGTLSGVKIQGVSGRAVELSYDATQKNLYLIVKGTRAAGNVVWTGKSGSNWDIAKTSNWSNNGFADIFVSNDSVTFDSGSTSKAVTLVDSVSPAYMKVDSKLAYTFTGTGAITGTTGLYKTNTSSLTINNRNTFSGKTIVDGGTLILKYVPSTTANGGIGPVNSDPMYLQLKDSAFLYVTTANEISARAMNVSGTAGGILNVANALYWNEAISGTKLTKIGSATLYIGNNNTNLTETVLKAGTIKLNTDASVIYGTGQKITLMGGTLETLNSTGSYLTSANNFDVPSGCTATVIAGARCNYNGTLTGSGTLNWSCDYIRAYLNGDWSAFGGTLNITANGANSTYENHFIVNNSNGFPNATVNIASGVVMCYKNGTSDNGTTTIKLGAMGGAGNFYNAGLETGSNNTSSIFSGVISGSTSIKKTGTGTWTLSGANTYTGTTTVSGGILNITGSIGASTATVGSGASLIVAGTSAGSVVVQTGGTATINGTIAGMLANSGTLTGKGTITGNASLSTNSVTSPAGTTVGTLTFKGTVTMNSSSTLEMQVTGGSSTCDKLAVTGVMTCAGTLNVSLPAGTLASGNSYQLMSAAGFSGTFATVNLPVLTDGLAWDVADLYTTGTIRVVQSTGIDNPTIKTGVLKNPTRGEYRVSVENISGDYEVTVTDLNGRVVRSFEKGGFDTSFELNITDQADGVYLLKITSGKAYSNLLKLVKVSR